jgi:ATP-dependent Clp protease protease subunit
MTLIPYVIERTSHGERSYDLFSRMLRDRIVFLNGGISTETSHAIIAQLLFLEAENPEQDITMYINSPGGLVTAGLAIYDTMQFIKPAVSTVVMGQAASMGSFLAMSGEKGKRYILPNASHLIHQPLGGAQGQASDIEIQAREILRLKKLLTDIYALNTGQPLDILEKDMDRDNIIDAASCVDYGLADHIISKRG